MPETLFRPPSVSLDLLTLPETLFCHPSASSSPFSLVFGSTAFLPWSMSLLRVVGLVDRSVKISSSCRSIGTVKRVWSKGSESFVKSGSLSLGWSKCVGLIN